MKINLAGSQNSDQPLPPINTNFIKGQFHGAARNLQEQLINGNALLQLQRSSPTAAPQFGSFSSSIRFPQNKRATFTSTYTGFGSNPANVEIIDEANLPNLRFKRKAIADAKNVNKRDLVTLTDGTIVDDSFFDTDWYDGLAQFGDKGLKQSLTKRDNLEDEIKEHDREPAQGEVEAVRAYCNHCLVEPFQSALVLSWKDAAPGHGVLSAKASTICGDF